jgi:hypothetical protein
MRYGEITTSSGDETMKALSVLYAIAALAFAGSALAGPEAAKTSATPPASTTPAATPPDCASPGQGGAPSQTVTVSATHGGKSAMDDWSARCAASHGGAQPPSSPPATVGFPALDASSKDSAK